MIAVPAGPGVPHRETAAADAPRIRSGIGRSAMTGKRIRVLSLLTLLVGLATPPATADVIHLKSGQKIEGKVLSEDASSIEVQTKFGKMTLKKDTISRVETKRLPKEELSHLVESAGDSPAKMFEAAQFAQQNKLTKEYREILEKVIGLDPSHSQANEALGRVYYDNQWFTPEELARYKATVADQMKEKGMVFYDGKWVKESTAKRLQGLEEYKGQWLTWKEIYQLQGQEKIPEILGVTLQITDSDHFSLRSELEEAFQQDLLDTLELAFDHFVKTFQPNPVELNIMTFYPIAVYVLPDSALVSKFVEPDGYMQKIYNPPKGINERYTDATSFPVFFPRPLIVTSAGRHLKGGGSREVSLMGFLSHYTGNMLIRRFKRNGMIPGWVETGVTHYYEASLNNYQTLSITEYTGYENIEKWKPGLDNFPLWYKKMADPEFRRTLPRFEKFHAKPAEEVDGFELVKAYFMVRWLLETDTQRFVDYVRLAYSDTHGMRVVVTEEQAFADTFHCSPDEFDARFEEWARTIPSVPPVGGG